MKKLFRIGERDYERWLREHPDGFAVNLNNYPASGNVHRASAGSRRDDRLACPEMARIGHIRLGGDARSLINRG
jgi:hypothetical protein